MVNFKETFRSNSYEDLIKQAEELNKKKDYSDPRFWKPSKDKSGNALVLVRFLPDLNGKKFVRVWHHYFQGQGGWYIEKNLSTIGKIDPVSELNSKLWNSTTDPESPARKQASDQKRKTKFISNVYIINDQVVPENNGKVFLYEYPKAIQDKLEKASSGGPFGEPPLDPWNLVEGANFALKIFSEKRDKIYPNYTESQLQNRSPLFKSQEEMEVVWKQTYDLGEFTDPANYKTYDQLKARLDQVIGGASPGEPTKPFQSHFDSRKYVDDDIPFDKADHVNVDDLLSSTVDSDDEAFRKLLEG